MLERVVLPSAHISYKQSQQLLTPHQVKEALRRRDAGEPMRDIARTYNVSHSTISRLEA